MGSRVLSVPAMTSLALAAMMIPGGVYGQDASSSPAPTLVPAHDIEAAGATRLDVLPGNGWLVTAGGSAWLSVFETVKQLDGTDGSELADITVPGDSSCVDMDVGFESVWVGACDSEGPSLVRIDPVTATATSVIALPIPNLMDTSSVAAGEGAVWALSDASSASTLVKVDPVTEEVVGTFALPDGPAPGGVRAGHGGVWITVPGADRVVHLDPADGSLVSEIAVGLLPRQLAIGEGSVWVMNEGHGTVSRIDPASDTVTATIPVGRAPIPEGDLAVGGGSVWAGLSDQLVARIDPKTDTVVARYGPPSGVVAVAADDDAAWILSIDEQAVWRLPLE